LANINSANASAPTDTVIEPIITNDEKHDKLVAETVIKIVYDSKWNSEYCTG
jgi:hypothetical protein